MQLGSRQEVFHDVCSPFLAQVVMLEVRSCNRPGSAAFAARNKGVLPAMGHCMRCLALKEWQLIDCVELQRSEGASTEALCS